MGRYDSLFEGVWRIDLVAKVSKDFSESNWRTVVLVWDVIHEV